MSDPVQECRPSGNPEKKSSGIGMPASIYLHDFGELVARAFDGEVAYLVGSAVNGSTWRDVDVRVMLDDNKYAAMGFGDPRRPQENPKWCAYVMAFSELGRKMTGLPIDFQIQQTTQANKEYTDRDPTTGARKHQRNALILGSIRQMPRDEPQGDYEI
jgi:hypothetical protein